MPASKKRKEKHTTFTSVAETPPMRLQPHPATNWRLVITPLIEALVMGAQHLGVSFNFLLIELLDAFEVGSRPALPPAPRPRLTPREQEIVALMADHLHNQQIAEILCIEITTLRTHLRHIYKKL